MNKKYIIRLEETERAELTRLVSVGKAAARKLLHARVLLKADAASGGPGWTDAEIELAVLSRQCLCQRIADPKTLQQQADAWQQPRNAAARPVDWQFTTADARIRLKRLYPQIRG